MVGKRHSVVAGLEQSVGESRRERRNCARSALGLARRVLANPLFSLLMGLLTVYALLGDDARVVCFQTEHDAYFNMATIASLLIFTIEIVLSSMVKDDYFLGFWFLADIFASASLIFDLTFVSEYMMGYPEISVNNLSLNKDASAVGATEYARASRSARVGTRVARLLRVVRLVRLSRIIRCFQCVLESLRLSKPADPSVVVPGDAADIGQQAESRVGRKLSERTTQRLIMLVLTMLIGIPPLHPGDYITMMTNSAQYGANVIFQAWRDYEVAALSNSTPGKLLRRKRIDWEVQVLTYIFYHNECSDGGNGTCLEPWLYKLCWIGYVKKQSGDTLGTSINVTNEGYIQVLGTGQEWDALSSNHSMRHIIRRVPQDVQSALAQPWAHDCSESNAVVHGVSLLRGMPCPRASLRKQETIWFTPVVHQSAFFEQYMEGQFVFVFDVRSLIEWEAILGMVQTVFVVIVLAIGALLFSRDVDKLVLLPIERMISKVETIRHDPLYAIRLGDLQFQDDRRRLGVHRASIPMLMKRKGKHRDRSSASKKQATMETKILENAIIKLGSLLALGFGEAGSEIIGQNLDDDNATVNAMIPGHKVEAIYGFCNIRNFTTTTEVLQEKTMVFVNQVAEIVHRIVHEHLGAANKNVGEAFLLVWRIGLYDQELRPKVADLAVMSFVQVVAELSRNRQLAEYRGHPALLARLPNFRVSLGFGLHLGWSIEGAIGSEFKIDASYLSPHVNAVGRLEAATAEYGVTILMSEPLVRSCNLQFSRHFRPVDHVRLQGSNLPTRLFTVDLHYEILTVESALSEKRRKSLNRYQERELREQLKVSLLQRSYQVHDVFDSDKDVRRMRERFFVDFFQEFEKGYLNYEAGEWDVAAKVLCRTKTMLRSVRSSEDGPSCRLLDYMRSFGNEAPSGWPGWRELKQK
uniref:Guanylate cyclase domain-containing protein n=1 Tax=Zooxanthella nutricula TaxID=1333877 RepID=A0A7S2PY98_9DINO